MKNSSARAAPPVLSRIRRSPWTTVVQGFALAGMILQPVPMARSYWTDSNNDGVKEWVADPDPAVDPGWLDADSDGDLMSNGAEALYGSDPYRLDSDFDGLTDKDEHDLTPLNDPWNFDSDSDGYSDRDEFYHDLQGTPLNVNYATLMSSNQAFYSYLDADGDGTQNPDDSDPTNNDRDGDGILNWQDGYMDDANNGGTPPETVTDTDGDGIPDYSDPFPTGSYWYNGQEYGGGMVDTDGDGTPDFLDAYPNGSFTYGGIEYAGGWVDQDNDGIPDVVDVFPNGSHFYNGTEYAGAMIDSDNDGIPDAHDPFPNGSYWYNATEYAGAWIDSDNDGVPDAQDIFPNGSYTYNGTEYSGQWVDQDSDGIPDAQDAFPTLAGSYWYNGFEYGGSWSDGDNDGIPDAQDAFPSGSYWYGGSEYAGVWVDADSDGIPDAQDAFPNGSYSYNGVEYGGSWADQDGDNVPDPADTFPSVAWSYWFNNTEYPGLWADGDNDQIPDPVDQWPTDWWNGAPHYAYGGSEYPGSWADYDSDGVPDPADSWPFDSENGLDSDGDGLDNYTERTSTLTDPGEVDTDHDFLTDFEELNIWHTDPLNAYSVSSTRLDFFAVSATTDLDSDGIPDHVEDYYQDKGHALSKSNATDANGDLDSDGVTNVQAYNLGWDLLANMNIYDSDRDGITDAEEDYWSSVYPGILDKNLFADSVFDSDGDGVKNYEEIQIGRDPGNANSISSQDGWTYNESKIKDAADNWVTQYSWLSEPTDFEELIAMRDGSCWRVEYYNTVVPSLTYSVLLSPAGEVRTTTTLPDDWDGDGMGDAWEHRHDLDLRNAADAGANPDNDGLTNLQESQHNTLPDLADSDADGYSDGLEVTAETNPNRRDDTPLLRAQQNLEYLQALIYQCQCLYMQLGLCDEFIALWLEAFGEAQDLQALLAQMQSMGVSSTVVDALVADTNAIAATLVGNAAPTLTLADWQLARAAYGAGTTPQDNWDGDQWDDLLEFALGSNPASGVPVLEGYNEYRAGLQFLAETDGSVTFYSYLPPGLSGITYALQKSPDLVAWAPVPGAAQSSLPEGMDLLSWSSVDGGGDSGFVRLAVTLDGGPTSYTQPLGWSRISFAPGTQSFGVTLLPPPLYCGTVKKVEGSMLHVQAIETYPIDWLTVSGRPAYLEFTEGPAEGERIDIDFDNSGSQSIALNLASANNTISSFPNGMAGARFVLRHYATLGETFPKELYKGANTTTRADRVMRWVDGAWVTYYHLQVPTLDKWVRTADSSLTDQGNQVLKPGEGVFITRADTTSVTKLDVGEVRSWRMRQLLKGAAKYNLLAGTFPLDQSPNGLGFTPAAGFAVNRSGGPAGQIQKWNGDTNPFLTTYLSYWLVGGPVFHVSDRWVVQADQSFADKSDTLVFPRSRAFFVRTSGSATAPALDVLQPLPAGVSFASSLNPYRDADGDGHTDYDHDGDGDSLPDAWEYAHFGTLENAGNIDTDGDGVWNSREFAIGTQPDVQDTDGDSLTDGQEDVTYTSFGLSPTNANTKSAEMTDSTWLSLYDNDGDGIPMLTEQNTPSLSDSNPVDAWLDSDSDGFSNLYEFRWGTPINVAANSLDSDNDAMSDAFEDRFHQDKNNYYDGFLDSDGDGLLNFEEAQHAMDPLNPRTRGGATTDYEVVNGGGSPAPESFAPNAAPPAAPPSSFTGSFSISDVDGDGLPNWWEERYGTYVRVPDTVADPDNDGLTNLQEYQRLTHPNEGDTDADTIPDGDDTDPGIVVFPVQGDPQSREIIHASDPVIRHLVSRGIMCERFNTQPSGQMGFTDYADAGFLRLDILPYFYAGSGVRPWRDSIRYYANPFDRNAANTLITIGNERMLTAEAETGYAKAAWKFEDSARTTSALVIPTSIGTYDRAFALYARSDLRFYYVSDTAAEEQGHVFLSYRDYTYPAILSSAAGQTPSFLSGRGIIKLPVGSDQANATYSRFEATPIGTDADFAANYLGKTRTRVLTPLILDADWISPQGVEVDEKLDDNPGYPIASTASPATTATLPTLKLHACGEAGHFKLEVSPPSLVQFTAAVDDLDASVDHLLSYSLLIAEGAPIPPITFKLLYSHDGAVFQEADTVNLLPIDLAIDANRDGTIASGEAASQAKPLRFWINNDSDMDANQESIGTIENSDDGNINTIRDLEDMQLLKLDLPSDFYPKIQDGTYKVGFKWTDTSGGTPAVKLFRTSADISDFSYLTSVTKAQAQLTNPSTQISYGTIQGGAVTWLPATALFAPGANPTSPSTQPHPFLLFEGHQRGSGKLTMVLQINGQQFDGPGVWLKLVDVKKMFDKAKGSPGTYPNPPEYTDQEPPRPGVSVDPEDMGEPFEAEPDEKNEAIILVHGWNMTDGDWRVFSSSFFKRLWWKGYKGRFYTFGWPTYNADDDALGFIPDHYNKSEYVAWKYGPALKSFVNGIQKGTKNVAAHSMGNVVMASALKSGLTVNSYVAMQAALPAGCYDASAGANDFQDFIDADQLDPTPDQADPDLGYRGLMAGVPTGNFHNFFSANDYALKTGEILGGSVSWEGNEISYKPNGWGNLYYDHDPAAAAGQRNPLWRAGNGPGGHVIARYATDHHEIMSFIARPRSEALGAHVEDTAGFTGFNLVTEIPQYGFGTTRTEHSGQFQRPIQKTEVFYKMLLRKMRVQFNDNN